LGAARGARGDCEPGIGNSVGRGENGRAGRRHRGGGGLRIRGHLPHRLGPAGLPRDPRWLRRGGGAQGASHFLLMIVFACLVSVVFATLLRDEPRAQLRTGALMLGAFVAAALALGWLMYPLPL